MALRRGLNRRGGTAPSHRRFVVVSGLPGSGKTTLGRSLAATLGLAFLDKDDELDRLLLAAGGAGFDPALRSTLSRRADAWLVSAALGADRGAVVVSFWRRPELSTVSGTPTDWLSGLSPLDEVHCLCPPDVAAARFAARHRHPGHGDAQADPDDRLRRFQALASLGPLGLGRRVVMVDTERPPDLATLAAALAA